MKCLYLIYSNPFIMNKFLFLAALSLTFFTFKAQGPYPSSNINLIGFINPETVSASGVKYSGCWGYNQTSKNKEYAVVGSSRGTYFIDITAPATPTVCDYVAGTSSPGVWREVNIYQNYAYVVSDNSPPNSFQIIDMQYLPDSVHVVHNSNSVHFERGHQVYVDGNKLYVAGIRFQGSGSANMRVYSLATPSAPVLLRTLSQDYPSITYVHDMFVRRDTVYAHCGNQGLHVYRFTASNTFSAIGSLTGYADAGYCHSGSITNDGKTFIMCDEVPTGLRIKSLNVSNLSNITMNALFRPNTNSQFVGHNPYVVGNKYAFVSCYQDGLYLYDISSPATPTIAGFFDTHPQGGASAGNNYGSSSYNGNWGAFPYFKSGLILACDMQNGVFILGATAFAPAANFNASSGICSGVATTFTNTSTNTPTSYAWTISGASPATSTLQTPIVTYSAGGVYNATLIAANASGTNSIVKSITVTASPTVTTGGATSVCAGSPATITATGASTYTWNPGALTGANAVVSPTATTIYTVVGLTGSCSNVKTKTLTVNPLPVVNATAGSTLLCTGQSVTLTGSGAVSYTWTPGSITGNPIAPSPTVTTSYSVIGTGTNSCSKTSVVTVSVSACTGISSTNGLLGNIEIVPNPNNGQFMINAETAESFDISIYNGIGQLIKSIPANRSNVEVDLSTYSKGMYYVLINANGVRKSVKVIIE
jgi:choice-of-anchor B domain-containing protein